MLRLRLLTFDLINTLVKVRGSPAHQYTEVARTVGVHIKESDIVRVYQPTWRQMKLDHPAYGVRDGMSNKEWWSEFVRRVFIAAGFNDDQTKLKRVSEALIERFNTGNEMDVWEMLPHVNKHLEDLKRSGFQLAVVSNSDNRTFAMLQTYGLASLFDFVVCTANTGLEKPNPEIFRRALELGGNVPPNEAAHIGDEILSDYLAPRKIGMHSFLIDRQRRLHDADLKEVDRKFVLSDISELASLVKCLGMKQ